MTESDHRYESVNLDIPNVWTCPIKLLDGVSMFQVVVRCLTLRQWSGHALIVSEQRKVIFFFMILRPNLILSAY